MLVEVYRERKSIAGSLLGVVLFLTLALHFLSAPSSRLNLDKTVLRQGEMAESTGAGLQSYAGAGLLLTGLVLGGLALTCLLVPAAAPVIVGALVSSWVASNAVGLGIGLIAVAGVASVAGGRALIATDR